ncbi:hypothetical protein EJ06DRAFT_530220 [Trichodelitschia bisporula]|uniref:Uncharacterized protein n=1 Tax=Trichodelitschia bisporula TaxID=703511 RepID=A0A6G1HW47_9PEZI|nr:hypothetical protein EJ06DRAFT_530220 [Trichodelitschia bisporula]
MPASPPPPAMQGTSTGIPAVADATPNHHHRIITTPAIPKHLGSSSPPRATRRNPRPYHRLPSRRRRG